jgi:Zn-dependent protease
MALILTAPPAIAMAQSLDPLAAVLTIVLVVISLGVHEASHAWTAWKLGDPTGKEMGRITLNPIPHIDLIMTIALPLLCYLTGMRMFGGAKPVPVNMNRLRHPWVDMALVSFAGPFSNFLLGIFFFALAKLAVATGYYNGAAEIAAARWDDLLPRVLGEVALTNVLLFVFNLVPIPPLDGSKVLAPALPESLRESFMKIGMYGLFLIYALINLSPGFRHTLYAANDSAFRVVENIVSLGGRW